MGTAKGGYEGFWDKRLDFVGRQASVAASPPSPGVLKRKYPLAQTRGRVGQDRLGVFHVIAAAEAAATLIPTGNAKLPVAISSTAAQLTG
jgi:hypothetical protein